MGRSSRWEYLKAIHPRYRQADRQEKRVILNEFCRNTGYHRKYAIRLLNGPPPGRGRAPRPRRPRTPTYSTQVVSVLGAVWEAAGYPCGVRLKARSEEHTSELQSQFHLVCRLLLEKKKR